jgi:hypothetical protein
MKTKMNNTLLIITTLLLFPFLVFAQNASSTNNGLMTIEFDEYSVEYDQEFVVDNKQTAYF